MIFCQDLLFIHVPKTAGMSITQYLLRALPRPVYYTRPAQDREPEPIPGVVEIDGIRHETLEEARPILNRYGFELERFPVILAVIRNPYALELSRYKFLQQDSIVHTSRQRQLAVSLEFAAFVNQTFYTRGLDRFFLLDGSPPPNLRLVRFENLDADLDEVLSCIGVKKQVRLERVNTSFHSDYRSYYTPETEAAVYQKYRWAFEAGYYQRMQLGEVPPTAPLKQEIADLKQELLALRIKHHELTQKHIALESWATALEQWAHELDKLAREQQAVIESYRRRLAPVRPLLALAGRLRGKAARTSRGS